jgi:pSer/pThr/pTyr-binding forkhead associated (FHA) protein
MLRPSLHKLFILDLRSTNGTHINGLPLGVGWAYALKDSDLITLAQLHLRFRLYRTPADFEE